MIRMPSDWVVLNTSDLIQEKRLEIGDGYRAKNSEMGSSGLPFIRAADVDGYIEFSRADVLSDYSVSKAGDKISRPGDVVLTAKGSVGRFAYVKPETPRFIYSPQLAYWRVRNPHFIDSRFLFFWMHGAEFARQIHRVKGLTDMADYVNLADQRRMTITLPPFPTQVRIASILSTYDDLIENNRRRIQILEEMPRAIYREWFVHFRFPGHEEVEVVDSQMGEIPQGWTLSPFTALADFQNGYAFAPQHWQKEGKPIVKIAEMKKGIGGTTSYYHGEDIPAEYHITTRDLLFAWSATLCVGFWTGGDALLNQHIFRVLPKKGYSKAFLLHSLEHRIPEFQSRTQGTTMRHIRRSALDEVVLPIPPEPLLSMFDELVVPMVELRINLRLMNRTLSQARDLLLRKLVSGEIDVSHLDLGAALPDTRQTSKYKEQSNLDEWTDGDDQDVDKGR